MKLKYKSQELNPWTFRHRSTLDSFHEATFDRAKQEPSFQDERQHTQKKACVFRWRQQDRPTKISLPQPIQRFHQMRIPVVALQKTAFEQISKTLILPNESHYRPIKWKRNQTRHCFISLPHRNLQNSFSQQCQSKSKESSFRGRDNKMRRYYSEQRQCQDQQSILEKQPFKNILSINPLSPQDTPHHSYLPVKIVRNSKKRHPLETVTRGKLFDDVMAICHKSAINGGGHLSQMKRTYNLKKLQKLINKEHSDS